MENKVQEVGVNIKFQYIDKELTGTCVVIVIEKYRYVVIVIEIYRYVVIVIGMFYLLQINISMFYGYRKIQVMDKFFWRYENKDYGLKICSCLQM